MGVEKLPLIAQSAVAAEQTSGCPAELLAAQCILESGWLDYAPQQNCFGIKSYQGEYGRQLLPTTEWLTPIEVEQFLYVGGRTALIAVGEDGNPLAPINGRHKYNCRDWFATFPTLAKCFEKRASLFFQGPYVPFASAYKANHDLVALVRGIGPIYATAPGYANEVLEIIGQHNVKAAIAAARA